MNWTYTTLELGPVRLHIWKCRVLLPNWWVKALWNKECAAVLPKLYLHLSSWNATRGLSKNAWCCRMLGYAKRIKPASCHRIHQPAWGKRPPKLFQSCSQFFQIAAAVCHSTPRKPLCYLSEVQEVLSFITDQCSLLHGLFSWSCHVSESI